MKYWHFTNWEPAPLEGALKSRVAVAIAAYENGDKNAIKEYYRQSATLETLQNPVVKIGGWAFSLQTASEAIFFHLLCCLYVWA